MTASLLLENVTCLGCGCACDDIGVTVRDGRIVDAHNACALGARWFGDGSVPSRCRVDGRDEPIAVAIDARRRTSCARRRDRSCTWRPACRASRSDRRPPCRPAACAPGHGHVVDRAARRARRPGARIRVRHARRASESRRRRRVLGRRPRAAIPAIHIALCTRPGRRARRRATVAHRVAVDIEGATTIDDADRRLTIASADEIATLTALGSARARPARRAPRSPLSRRFRAPPGLPRASLPRCCCRRATSRSCTTPSRIGAPSVRGALRRR